jgi:nucleoporin NUP159
VSNDSKLVVGLTSGPVLVYDVPTLISQSSEGPSPSHVFPTSDNAVPLEVVANPADLPHLVAVLYETSPADRRIAILDVQNSQSVCSWTSGGTPETKPSCSK